jgi:hypothetical protein
LLKNAPSGTKLSIYLVQCEFEKKKILELAEERPSFQIRTTPKLKELENSLYEEYNWAPISGFN